MWERYLQAEMFIGTIHLVDGIVRYQLQTWGGTRSAESRITDGLAPIRGRTAENDLLLFQRRADALDRFRLILLKRGTPEFAEADGWAGTRRWGTLLPADLPVTQGQ